jgi:hypothetical protein
MDCKLMGGQSMNPHNPTRRAVLAALGAGALGRAQILGPILGGRLAVPRNGLIARYEIGGTAGAQGAAIGTFKDLSGNGYDATQSTGVNKPAVNTHTVSGGRALLFNGSATAASNFSYMSMPAGLAPSSQSLSAVMILEPTAVQGTNDQYALDFSASNNNAYIRYNPQLKGGPAIGVSNPGMYIPWGPQMFGFSSSAAGWKYILRNVFSSSAGTVAASSPAGGSIMCYGAGQFNASGNLYAVFVYNRALTQADINQIWNYAQAVYRCRPFSTQMLMACCGDSQTSGYTASGYNGLGWLQQWLIANPAYTAYNFALTGSKTSALNNPDSIYSATPTKRICFIWSGTNDNATGAAGTWVAGGLTNIQNFVSARRATGWKVVTATMLPRTGGVTNGSYEADRQTFNAALTTNSGGIYGDAIADIGSNSTIGVAGAQNNSTYYGGDTTHLTQAGLTIAEGIFASAIAGI